MTDPVLRSQPVTDDAVERAFRRFVDATNSMIECRRCKGRGYHHGFGENGHDPDWCEECGGNQFVSEFTDKQAMREALSALPLPEATGGREDLADKVLADPKVIWLRECGFNSAARFESELRAAIERALALSSTVRGTP